MDGDKKFGRLGLAISGLVTLVFGWLVWVNAESAIHQVLAEVIGLSGTVMLIGAVIVDKLDETASLQRRQVGLLEQLVAGQMDQGRAHRAVPESGPPVPSPMLAAAAAAASGARSAGPSLIGREAEQAQRVVESLGGRDDLTPSEQQKLARALVVVAKKG